MCECLGDLLQGNQKRVRGILIYYWSWGCDFRHSILFLFLSLIFISFVLSQRGKVSVDFGRWVLINLNSLFPGTRIREKENKRMRSFHISSSMFIVLSRTLQLGGAMYALVRLYSTYYLKELSFHILHTHHSWYGTPHPFRFVGGQKKNTHR